VDFTRSCRRHGMERCGSRVCRSLTRVCTQLAALHAEMKEVMTRFSWPATSPEATELCGGCKRHFHVAHWTDHIDKCPARQTKWSPLCTPDEHCRWCAPCHDGSCQHRLHPAPVPQPRPLPPRPIMQPRPVLQPHLVLQPHPVLQPGHGVPPQPLLWSHTHQAFVPTTLLQPFAGPPPQMPPRPEMASDVQMEDAGSFDWFSWSQPPHFDWFTWPPR